MLRVIGCFISAGWLVALLGCAGERRGLVASDNKRGNMMPASYALLFSAINPRADGTTTVSVKLHDGNVPITVGALSKAAVTLRYRVDEPLARKPSEQQGVCDRELEKFFSVRENYGFKEFDGGGKNRLREGEAEFEVTLATGELHQLLAAAEVPLNKDKTNKGCVWDTSGLFEVPAGDVLDGTDDKDTPITAD